MGIGPGNVGFTLWMMSKRIAGGRELRRACEALHTSLMARLGASDRVELDRITTAVAHASQGADLLWNNLRAAVESGDAGLIEPTESGVDVIRNHGSAPDALARVKAIWGSSPVIAELQSLAEQLDELLARNGQERRHIMGQRVPSGD